MAKASLEDLLVPGITGYINRVKPIESEVQRLFKSCCHAAAREVAGTVSSYSPAEAGRNYHIATIDAPGRTTESVLLHAVLPLVAGARHTHGNPLVFASIRRLERFFPEPLLVIAPELLERAWDPDHLPTQGLGEQEWYDINYWEPQRIGDVVFNRFD